MMIVFLLFTVFLRDSKLLVFYIYSADSKRVNYIRRRIVLSITVLSTVVVASEWVQRP